jgi:hypothetical protein
VVIAHCRIENQLFRFGHNENNDIIAKIGFHYAGTTILRKK